MCPSFLPALLITSVGSELHASTALHYVPVLSKNPAPFAELSLTILVWALVYTLLSMELGWVFKRAFKFPAWAVPAICFNNTTALPLLLIQSFESSGILADLAMNGHDTSSAIASRAKSYFLVSSMIGNSLAFALGPRLLDDEHAPDDEDGKAIGGGQREEHMEEEDMKTRIIRKDGLLRSRRSSIRRLALLRDQQRCEFSTLNVSRGVRH